MKVNQLDLVGQYKNIKEEMINAIDEVIGSGRFIMGNNVKELEKEIAEYTGVKHAIGVANGSDALFISVNALGLGEGDYVITTPYSFFATVSCITRNGATPVMVDIDPETYNIDLEKVIVVLENHPEKEKIKGFIPVHIFGQTVDLNKIEEIKKKYNLKVIEDCAQSIGSTWTMKNGEKKKSGQIGDLSIFSFFPTKNLGAYGDGGMIITDNDELADFCRMFRVHGAEKRYHHKTIGINSRLDELQAAILRVKFKYLNEFTSDRIKVASLYKELFEKYLNMKEEDENTAKFEKSGITITVPNIKKDFNNVFHQYVIRIDNGKRDELKEYLKENEIGTSIYYPKPLHLQECFSYLGYREGILPISERASLETIALPIYPEMNEEQVEYVVKNISDFLED